MRAVAEALPNGGKAIDELDDLASGLVRSAVVIYDDQMGHGWSFDEFSASAIQAFMVEGSIAPLDSTNATVQLFID
jgi:hypothetical protein